MSCTLVVSSVCVIFRDLIAIFLVLRYKFNLAHFEPIYICHELSFQVGQKKAREMWFLARFYSAEEADKMGLVNKVVPVSSRLVCSSFMQFMASYCSIRSILCGKG